MTVKGNERPVALARVQAVAQGGWAHAPQGLKVKDTPAIKDSAVPVFKSLLPLKVVKS